MQFTYQARLELDEKSSSILDNFASKLSSIERKLHADISSGAKSSGLKNDSLKKYQITARQFNACRVSIEGKRESVRALQIGREKELKDRIDKLGKTIEFLEKKDKKQAVHQKKRSLSRLKQKLEKLQKDIDSGIVRICFGTKKLFNAQFNLAENNYKSHEEWKKDWDFERSKSFFVLGSKDETAGNQSCTASIDGNGSLDLRLRLPNDFSEKYLKIPNAYFKYGHQEALASLDSCFERRQEKDSVKKKLLGQAINYRFVKDHKGWRVFVTTDVKAPKPTTNKLYGAIGVDINADHLAIAETDRFGNVISTKSIPLVTYGKSKNQSKATIGDAAAEIVKIAKETGKSIVVEKLDFQKKKSSLRETGNKKHSRMLSSLSYSTILSFLESRAFRNGVLVETVNPAYTSFIGLIKFAKRYGLSVHHAAAFCIARRFLGFSERMARSLKESFCDKGNKNASPSPARKRSEHVWRFWAILRKKIQVALAAHFRAGDSRSKDRTTLVFEIINSRKLLV